MRYVSTRGAAPVLGFDDVLLAGLATDGGLYVPERWPAFDPFEIRGMKGSSYVDLAARVMTPYVAGSIPPASFRTMIGEAYARFDDPEVAPLRELGDGLWLLELFHGPTLAFKDYALQLVGHLFDHVLRVRGERVTIVGATSGDTGSAAIEACRDRANIEIFILRPRGRVSEVQRRQMTTVDSPNVHNVAIDGTFDDCQDLVKAMFGDHAFRSEVRLSAVNSINWARVMAQIVYYFWAALKLGAPDQPVAFAVPTGNFGNVYAGYAAGRMGLPVPRLGVGSNTNDILTRFLDSGRMATQGVVPTLSPSMDIQVSSNFERLLFELEDRKGSEVAATMKAFRESGAFRLDRRRWKQATALFSGRRLDDDGTIAEIRRIAVETGTLVDPHSAIGVAAARALREETAGPVVALATAHPAKFPDAVERATGTRPRLPERLADLLEREERYATLPADLAAVQTFVRERAGLRGAA